MPLGRHDGRAWRRGTKMSTSDNWWRALGVPGNLEADLVPFRASLQVPGTGVSGTIPNRQGRRRLSNIVSSSHHLKSG